MVLNDEEQALEDQSHKHCFCCTFLVISITQDPHEACCADSLSLIATFQTVQLLVKSVAVNEFSET